MKKNYMIVFISMAIYFLVVFFLFNINSNSDKKVDEFYLLFRDKKLIHFMNNEWNELSNDNDIIYSNKFLVYEDNQYIGKYDVRINDKLYLFDNNRDSIKIDGEFFAVATESEFGIIDYEIESIDNINDEHLMNIIKKYKLKLNNINDLNINQKILLDFDNDNYIEELYFISNMFNSKNINNDGFSFVYYIDNKKNNVIYNTIASNKDKLNSYFYDIANIIDYDNDNKYEIIINHQQFSRAYPTCRSILKLEKNKYVVEKSCD